MRNVRAYQFSMTTKKYIAYYIEIDFEASNAYTDYYCVIATTIPQTPQLRLRGLS